MAQVVCDVCAGDAFGVFTENEEEYQVVCESCGTEWAELRTNG